MHQSYLCKPKGDICLLVAKNPKTIMILNVKCICIHNTTRLYFICLDGVIYVMYGTIGVVDILFTK